MPKDPAVVMANFKGDKFCVLHPLVKPAQESSIVQSEHSPSGWEALELQLDCR